jgi:hypothetical protein
LVNILILKIINNKKLSELGKKVSEFIPVFAIKKTYFILGTFVTAKILNDFLRSI